MPMPNQTNHLNTFLDGGGFAEGGLSCWGVWGVMEEQGWYVQKNDVTSFVIGVETPIPHNSYYLRV
ncbi:MAG TPA: hypothetical protein DD706_03535 [Nitrospiraceae bacterium]|nr:hypothetical protein [Nitrospiraceae bacterium]